jgi:formylglycine-generating enzyme required for sulfatase activity
VGKYLDPRRHPAGDSLSDELVGIIDRALARQPECRYATAQELARDIFSYLEGARDLERKRQEADRQVARGLLFTQHWRRLRERLASAEAELTAGSEQVMPHWSLRRKAHLWQRRLRVERLRRGEGERFTRAAASFLRALGLYPEHRGARRNLVALHWEKLLEAESARDARAAAYHQQMVREYDDGTFAGAIRGQGRLRLQLHAPPAATSTVHVLLDRGPTLEEGMRVRDLGHGSISTTLELPMGPYVLRVARTGWPSLCFPFRVARQSNEAVHLIYPARGSDPLEEEFVVIPGARYELGGDPEVTDRPRREVELDDFLMARFPVTCAQYLAFLNDLVQLAPAVAGIRVPRMITGRPLWERAGPGRTYVLPERQVTPYAFATDHPVVAISWLDAHAYCEWRTLKDPESRTCFLPSPEEWEAAGRTADGRLFPWGNRYDPCLANNRESHKGRPCIMSVNSFPTDCSPFGVRGLAGNVAEWCAGYGSPGSRQLRIARGGHWNGGEEESRLARWQTYRADDVSPTLGFRICRMLHRRPSTQEVL